MMNEKIKKQALNLSSEERAELAHILIESLPLADDIGSEEAWSKELKRRIDDFEQGKSSVKPWREVKKNALSQLDS